MLHTRNNRWQQTRGIFRYSFVLWWYWYSITIGKCNILYVPMMIRTWHWWGCTSIVVYKRYKVLRAMVVIDSRHVRWQRSEKRAGHGQRTSSSSAHSCCSGTCGCTPETQYERRKRQGQRSQYYDSTTCYVSMNAYNKSGGVSSHKCCTMLHKSHKLWIECFHVTSSPLRLRRKTENSRHVGV